MRENREIVLLLPAGSAESIRKQIDDHTTVRQAVSISVDLPLSNECKQVLAYSAKEAERLDHRHIGTDHLLLGLLREHGSFAAAILHERGLTLDQLRERFSESVPAAVGRPFHRPTGEFTVNIHGTPRSVEPVRERVRICRALQWYWHKRPWTAQATPAHRARRGGVPYPALPLA